MGVVQTSKSRLLTQPVRVDRRLRRHDGMGGTYQEWETVIQRYFCRIYPDHSQKRARAEEGETPSTTHRAIANRSFNGKSVMIGDRFIDGANNYVYDVVQVVRGEAKLAYGQVVQYGLKLVLDACGEGAAS
jgi:hypothetical protein